ncbi:transcription factor [Myotisia sp. PD_48]|nr:transcription factor [Myotisia sp. PD_48]
MPPSAKRRNRRRDLDLHDEPVDMDALDSSPSRRSVKKRKVEHTPQPELEPEPELPSADDNDEENEASTNQDLMDGVISTLGVAKDPVAVMNHHSNAKTQRENKESVKAYAKIAGRDWTYFVKSLHVNIGRPPDRDPRPDAQSSPITVAAQALPEVHIDLGPSKFVSRLHAEIYYDGEEPPCWRIRVNGRNGIRLNNIFYKRGTATQVSCGDIVEIANTQMMFVTPGDQAVIDPSFLHRLHGVPVPNEDGVAWDSTSHAHPGAAGVSSRRMSFNSSQQAATTNGVRRELAPAAIVTPKRQTTPTPRPRSRDTVEAIPPPKLSPGYRRGMMMESTEEIDYSEDAAKDIKPPFSYANMIAQAIFSTEEEKLSLSNIYKFIMQKYAFYRHSQSGWQNSIRHNLSLNKAFQKVPRRTDEPGKGMKWQIVPEHREEYWKKQSKRSGQSSAPSSPIGKEKPNLPRSNGHRATLDKNGDSPSAPGRSTLQTASPGYHSFSVAPVEAYTPDRGSRNGPGLNGATGHTFDDQSPLPHGQRNISNRTYGLSDNAVASPPVLSSSYYDDAASSMITPAPLRQQPRLAPPSTAQIPSRFMPMSSPAQFWKFAEMGSTPARPIADLSPLKPGLGSAAEPSRWNTMIPSSSPPPTNFGSPSKPGPSSRGRDRHRDDDALGSGEGESKQDGWDDEEDENAEDEEFDLARGFQPIGSYHQKINSATRAT